MLVHCGNGFYKLIVGAIENFEMQITMALATLALSIAGKFIVGYVPTCQEKEYYLACACQEIYAPPSAYFSLFGLTVQASFLGGN